MAWPQDALSDGEVIITSFRPHWKLLIIPALWFIGFSVVTILIAVNLDLNGWVWWIVFGVLLVFLVIFVVRPVVDWYSTRYVLTNERLITRTGVIAKTGVEIPLENITNVNFSQSVIERMLGAGDLVIESAGTSGQSKFSNIPHPDDFQVQLYKTREQRSVEMSGSGRATAPAAADSSTDKADAIRKLSELHSDGLISDEEYEAKRKELLDGM